LALPRCAPAGQIPLCAAPGIVYHPDMQSQPIHWRRVLAASLLLLAAACVKPQPPAVTPEVARVVRVTSEGVELEVTLGVKNPNAFALDAHEVEGTLIVEGGQRLGTGKSHPNRSIPAHGTSTVQSQVHIAWDDVPALQKFLLQERVPYRFQGNVTLGGDTLHVTLPFEMQGTLTREQLLQAGLRGLFNPN
jgi:LEA14-like dessication related protein